MTRHLLPVDEVERPPLQAAEGEEEEGEETPVVDGVEGELELEVDVPAADGCSDGKAVADGYRTLL